VTYCRAVGELIIEPIPCLKDNYAYLVREAGARDAYLVDPSEAGPPGEALRRHGLALRGILATHHHPDHVGGIVELARDAGASLAFVAAFAGDRGRIPGQTVFVAAPGDRFAATELVVAGRALVVRHIPGHTRGAMALGLAGDGGVPTDVFTGDTLFGAGCGRLFEGTPAEMWSSLQALAALPASTRLWFGHEYTASNLRFAETVEPDNQAVRARAAELASGARTTPTTVALERETNPFVRAATVEALAERRAAKDRF
jgi:hydroxyacylglutathione hydrolase